MPVEGLSALERRWARVPALVREEVSKVMEQTATEIVAEMKSIAPRRTGTGADSIGWTWGDAPAGSMTIGTVGAKEYGSLRIVIYAGAGDAFYMRFQEFGTLKMAANPFFFPVWRARKRRTRGRITRAINKAIKRA